MKILIKTCVDLTVPIYPKITKINLTINSYQNTKNRHLNSTPAVSWNVWRIQELTLHKYLTDIYFVGNFHFPPFVAY